MRSSVLLVVGLVMMAGAFCFAAIVAVGVVRDNNEKQVVAPSVAPDPVEPVLVEPVGKRAEQAEDYDRPTLNIPDAPTPRVVREPPSEPELPPKLVGSVPAADTRTPIAVRTCDGGKFRLSIAEKQLFELHNRARTNRNIKPLCIAPDLTKVARIRSQDMLNRDYFSHYTPDGTTVSEYVEQLRIPEPGRGYVTGENISLGGNATDTDTPSQAFEGLMNSPGHKENILRDRFQEVGIGAKSGTYQQYDDVSTIYTTVFGGWY